MPVASIIVQEKMERVLGVQSEITKIQKILSDIDNPGIGAELEPLIAGQLDSPIEEISPLSELRALVCEIWVYFHIHHEDQNGLTPEERIRFIAFLFDYGRMVMDQKNFVFHTFLADHLRIAHFSLTGADDLSNVCYYRYREFVTGPKANPAWSKEAALIARIGDKLPAWSECCDHLKGHIRQLLQEHLRMIRQELTER